MSLNGENKLLKKIEYISEAEATEIIKDIGILILTATDIETETLMKYLKPLPGCSVIKVASIGTHRYSIGVLENFSIVHVQSEMGAVRPNSSTLTVYDTILFFNPKAIIMVGIAFGANEEKQKIGDVLVSEAIIPYEIAKIQAGQAVFRGPIPLSGQILYDRFTKCREWVHQLPNGRLSEIIHGKILSGEKLIDDFDFKKRLLEAFPEAVGGEMEGCGLFSASFHNDFNQWIVVKGICDWAFKKNVDPLIKQENQRIAAEAAVSLCLAVFQNPYAFESLEIFNANYKKKIINEVLNKMLIRSKAYYNELRGSFGRFRHLDISETILADLKSQNSSEEYINANVNMDGKHIPLKNGIESLWNKECKHTIIIGEGGMGKTVSLIKLWEVYIKERTEDSPIPLFLALNEYNSDKSKNDFIIRMIEKYYYNDVNSTLNDASIKSTIIDALNTRNAQENNYVPSVVLFLDGFNEITADESQLLDELEYLARKMRGLQLVITSRYDIRKIYAWDGFADFELVYLTDSQIEEYLKLKSVEMPSVEVVQLLKIPMMLTIYTRTCEIIKRYITCEGMNFKKIASSTGEILWNFVESHLVKPFQMKDKNKMIYNSFLLKHLLPYIGYKMEFEGKFFIHRQEMKKIINEAYMKFDCDDFLDVFHQYCGKEELIGIGSYMRNDINKRYTDIEGSLCKELIMLVIEGDNSFTFLHQNFRDYFAAVHILNEIQLGLFRKQIPQVLTERQLPFYIRAMVGEIEGEHQNRPLLIENEWSMEHYRKTLLDQCLYKLCKDIFDGSARLCVWNIIEIWKEVRGVLIGTDLSHLDLRDLGFHGVNTTDAMFDYSLIDENNFIPIEGHTSSVESVRYNANGSKILSASSDMTIKEWDIASGRCIKTYKGHTDKVTSAIYSLDEDKIISASFDCTIKVWSIESGICIGEFKEIAPIVKIIYSPSRNNILSLSSYGFVTEWDIKNHSSTTYKCKNRYAYIDGMEEQETATKEKIIDAVYIDNDEKILTITNEGTIDIWESGFDKTVNNNKISIYMSHSEYVAFSPNGDKVLTSLDETINEWDATTGKRTRVFKDHIKGRTQFITYSLDERKILSISNLGNVHEWDSMSGKCIRTYKVHSNKVRFSTFSPNSDKILSALSDGRIEEWDVSYGRRVKIYSGYQFELADLAYNAQFGKLLSANTDGTMQEWDLSLGKVTKIYDEHLERVVNVVYSPRGDKILSTHFDGTIIEWNINTGKIVRSYEDISKYLNGVIYSPDGEKILLYYSNGIIKELNAKTGKCIRSYLDHMKWVNSVVYSSNGTKILSASDDGTIKEWDTATGKVIETYDSGFGVIRSAVYDSDCKKILFVCGCGHIKEWDIASKKCIKTYIGNSISTKKAIYCSSNKYIFSVSDDGAIIQWNTKSGACVREDNGHQRDICNVIYSPKDNKVLSGSSDGIIKEWDAETGECTKVFKTYYGILLQGCSFRNLNPKSIITKEARETLTLYGVEFE